MAEGEWGKLMANYRDCGDFGGGRERLEKMATTEIKRYRWKLVAAVAKRGQSKLAVEAERSRGKLVAAEID